ncbi:IPT/TIG domain-containing protein [Heterostelium album PN500]|uniref:IPT/TIG domain-containing protein n=1 Tax=Heterostelium pallidum (strain ATCC 26659 / Pp 5 / PN500) TaxID=670386 RepID=D3BTR8_HETP5|nr:IPT/TIG domain-containing protein [Heterostelium album PN500]EFA75104.1 IPT/TIG domain-containing protein [Heterostelium album PN500]|eukprot:XP_020427238.1 IPT/TIG domain-containing protein [Heterostelium album PN500]
MSTLYIYLLLILFINKTNFLNSSNIPIINDIKYDVGSALVYGSNMNSVANVTVTKLGSSSSDLLHFVSISSNDSVLQVNFDGTDVYYGTIELCSSVCARHQWNPIVIDSISMVPTQGGNITINGYYLLPFPQLNNSLTFTKWSITPPTVFNNISMIVVQYQPPPPLSTPKQQPQPSGSNVTIDIQIKDSILKRSYSFKSPVFELVEVINSSLHINGQSFGSDVSLLSVKLDGVPLNITQLISHYNITCSFADNPLLYYSSLSIAGIKKLVVDVNNNPSSFDYINRPIVNQISTVASNTGGTVSINGELFASILNNSKASTNVSVSIGNGAIVPTDIKIVNNTLITFAVPPKPKDMVLSNLELVVTIDGASSIAQDDTVFSYDRPTLVSSKQIVDNIVITGRNIALSSMVVVFFDKDTSLRPDSLSNNTNNNDTLITFDVDSIPYNIASGSYSKVYINANNIRSNYVTVNIKPIIVSSTHAPVQGGLVTLFGRFWNADTPQTSIKVTIGGKACPLSSPPSPAAIRCFMPPGTGLNQSIQLQLNGSVVDRPDNYKFQYQNPVIVDISEGSSKGGVVTLIGANFANKLNISLGNQTCDKSTYVNDTMVLCDISASKLSNLPADTLLMGNVTVDGLSGTALLYKFSKTTNINNHSNTSDGFKLIYIIPIVVIVFALISIGVIIYVKRRRPKKMSIVQIQLNLLRPSHLDDEQFEERWYEEQLNMLIREGIPKSEAKAYLKWFQENKDK